MNEDEQNGAGSSQGHGRSPSRNTTHSQMHNSPFSPAPLRFPSINQHYVPQPAFQGQHYIQEQTERYPGFAYGQMQPPPQPQGPPFVVTHPNAQGYVGNQQQAQINPTHFHQWQTQPSAQQNVHKTATYQPGLQAQALRLFQQQPQMVGVPEVLRPGTYTPATPQNVHQTPTYQPGLQAQPLGLFQQQPQMVGAPEMLQPLTYTPIPQHDVHQTPKYQASLHAQPLDPFLQRQPFRPDCTYTYVGAPLSPAGAQVLQEQTERHGGKFIYDPKSYSQAPSQTSPQNQPQNRTQEPLAEQVPPQQQNRPHIHPQSDRPRRRLYRREHYDAQDESDSGFLQTNEQGPHAISNANVQQPDFNIAGYPENPGYEAGDDVTSDELDHHDDQFFTGFNRPSPVQSPDITLYHTTAGNPQTPSVKLFRPELNGREQATDIPRPNLGQSTTDQSNSTRVGGHYHGQEFSTVQIGPQHLGPGQEFHTTFGAMAFPSRSETIHYPPQSEADQFPSRSEAIHFPPQSEAIQFLSPSEVIQFPQFEIVQPQRQPENQHHIQHNAAERLEESSSYDTSLEDAFRCNVGDENYPPSGEEDSDYYKQQSFSDHGEPGRSNALANLGPSDEHHPPAGPSNYTAGARLGQYNHQRDLAQSEQVNPWAAYPMHPAASVPAPVPAPTTGAITRPESHNQALGPLANGIKMKERVVFNSLSGEPAPRDDPRRIAWKKKKEDKRAAAEEKKREKKERGGGGLFGLFKKEGSKASQPAQPAKGQTLPVARRLEAAPAPAAHAGTLPAPAAAITTLVRSGAASPAPFGAWGPPLHPPPTGPLPRTPVCRHCQAADCPRCYYCHELGCELCWYCHQAVCHHQPLATLHPPHRP